ncbi:MAG: hypothetical protein P4L81_01535 [Candidatus Pacebacteria bacterium]|nr:hypothetical protein [Candidatus Paceibacterota bacterium]
MNDFTFDVGLAFKLKQAAVRNGIEDAADIDWLCQGKNLADIRRVRLGYAAITIPEHLIDLDTDPFVPKGWKVEEHRKGGHFKWDATKVVLYSSKRQRDGKWMTGDMLREELKGKSVYNANLLDYLLKHPLLIPEEWKGTPVSFWGTAYCHPDVRLFVRCLYWYGDWWHWRYCPLDGDWDGANLAAVHVS